MTTASVPARLKHIAASFFVLSLLQIATGCAQQQGEKDSVIGKGNQMNAYEKIRDGEFELPDLASLPPDGGPEFNRLVFTSSPYLLQHARNPVDWYPWGEEAFEKARREDKPIFLSIGYSTCHWCHVMEHESFEDSAVAAYMNEHFISIKVDREERPDVDHIYMSVCQAMTGSGGWPLSIFMSPDKQPFYAGTYFPKDDRFGRPGFMNVLQSLSDVWKNDREKVKSVSVQIKSHLSAAAGGGMADVKESVLNSAVTGFKGKYDPAFGGFGPAPKFPMGHTLSFMLRRYDATGDEELLRMVEHTLERMYAGGIWDHLGNGFCRYSTDAKWLIPHFEKMLYDNALLLTAYVDAYQVTGKALYARVAREIMNYVEREMTDKGGAFYSAENADSEGEEGKFYVFTREEFMDIVGDRNGRIMAEYYGVEPSGNFEKGQNNLHLAVSQDTWMVKHDLGDAQAAEIIAESREKLYDARAKRVHPSLDDKILTSWNGLMISALARMGQALGDEKATRAARRAADFILDRLLTGDGTLLHRYRAGEAGIPGFLEDYAFMVWGLIDLYEATFDVRYLTRAVELNKRMLGKFRDDIHGGLYFTSSDAEELLVRSKDSYDGALPSGNSVAALNLVRLSRMTGDTKLEDRAQEIIRSFGEQINSNPTASAVMLTALDFAVEESREIVLAAESREEIEDLAKVVRSRYMPRKVLLFHEAGAGGAGLRGLAPYAEHNVPVDGKPSAYVCENFRCKLPVTLTKELLELLDE